MQNELYKINQKTKEFQFLELSIYSYNKGNLSIAASCDFSYYHNFEIKFINVFAIIANNTWNADLDRGIILEVSNLEEAKAINLKYRVEKGNRIFKMLNEDNLDFYVIAEDIQLVDKVHKYY